MNKIKQIIRNNFQMHKKLYIGLFSVYILGVLLGLVVVLGLDIKKKEELGDYIVGFINLYDYQSIEPFTAFWGLLWTNVKYVLVIWMLGASIVGVPFLFGVMCIRGFSIGFTSSVFIWIGGVKGGLFDALGMVPGEILSAPILIFICVTSVSFSMRIIKRKKEDIIMKRDLLNYCGKIFLGLVLLSIVSFIDSWIIPLCVKIFFA